ncbi:MAG TPA: ABC transporter permease subunit, partial [Gemmatimonadaceae bacterium]|nr:ABC transporter permease subunit [Gemmatimonadaceae bacterium]
LRKNTNTTVLMAEVDSIDVERRIVHADLGKVEVPYDYLIVASGARHAYFVRGVPLVTSAVESSLRQMDPSLEDAARGLGASWWLAMRRVVIPAARPGLAAGATLAAITAVGEFVASVVLYTHANRPISMEILAQLRNLSFGTAAAYSVLLILLVLLITVVARLVGGRAERVETIPTA